MKNTSPLHLFLLLFFSFVLPHSARAASLPELEGKGVAICLPQATTLELDQWYVMYNVGRKGFLYDAQTKLYIATAPPVADDAQYLVRLVEKSGKTYVQTGLGRYFTTLSTSNNSGTISAANVAYTYGSIAEGYFWLKDSKGMVLDANALDADIKATSTVAGWGTTTPNSTTGNNSWVFYPVELTDLADDALEAPRAHGNFSFQNAHNDRFITLDSNNLNLTDTEQHGTAIFAGTRGWRIDVPEGTSSKPSLHIGTDGKFSAGPASPIRLYHVWPISDTEFRYTEVATLTDGAMYLFVGEYEGKDYAMAGVVGNAGSSNQRVLSSRVTFTPDPDSPILDGTTALIATFTGTNASTPALHHWAFHYAEAEVQEPFVYKTGETGGSSGQGEPLLTIACVSDIHTQEGWLSATEWQDQTNAVRKPNTIANVAVRESLTEVAKALKQEGVDVLIVGGDCQSDATVDEEHWRQVRRLMADALRSVGEGEEMPVLYVNGNHEYEVASTWGGSGTSGYYNWRSTRPFNAGEYYDWPMLGDVGVLAAGADCYYEDCPNDNLLSTKKTMPVLAAYHYNLKGFDFIVLNCAKHLFHNANNYTYSDESIEWVARKLQQIYADDPQHSKSVFLALHIPFGDSNSININEDKGMSYAASTRRLKEVLAQYPGLVMLYGHDHGQDNAYIRRLTSQRVTRYDTSGNVIASADGVTAFDKDLTGASAALPAHTYSGQSVYFHPYTGKTDAFLGIKGTFNAPAATPLLTIAALDDPSSCTIYPEDGGISLRLGDGSEHLYYNSGFKLTASEHQLLKLYKCTFSGTTFTVTPVQQVEDGEVYLIGGGNYIFRVGNSKIFPSKDSYNTSSYTTFFWRAELPKDPAPSFVSTFMGSLRYYNNSCGEPANSSRNARKLIQGLIIYVYPDRIVFNMKNFRNNVGSRVRNELAPYIVKRTTPAPTPEAIVAPNPSKAYYRRVDNLAQLCNKSVLVFVDEDRGKTFGMANNNTQKFQPAAVTPAADGTLSVSRNTTECEFVIEHAPDRPDGTPLWYLRSRDGYIKNADTKFIHRQQAENFYTSSLLSNEAFNARLTPWTITLGEDGVAEISNEQVGTIQRCTTGMTTSTLHIYQKVVAPTIDTPSGIATLYSEHALMMTDEAEAYTIDGLNSDGSLRLVRQPGSLPAKTPVVLHLNHTAPETTSSSIALPVLDDRYLQPLTNYLRGTLSDILTPTPLTSEGTPDTSVRYYRLSDEGCFLPAFGTGEAYVNPSGEAYLTLPATLSSAYDVLTSTPVTEWMQQAEVNGIKDVIAPHALPADATIYSLTGQRISRPTAHGIYIVGGKKIVK